MAKGPFHFKTFTVEQDGAAMKVGMDGIVLGCWSPIDGVKKVMDIGPATAMWASCCSNAWNLEGS